MSTNDHADAFRVRRLVRDSLPPRPAPAFKPAQPPIATEPAGHTTLEDDVTQSIKSIEHVVKNFGSLKENFHFYKDLVGELRGKLEEEKAQREQMQREVAAMERAVQAERERAARAEQHIKASEGVIRDLERELASVQAQTSRLVKAITSLISAEADVHDAAVEGGLRLVS
jgi:septal ring factor EnvC (AmiA/AmiB activator)